MPIFRNLFAASKVAPQPSAQFIRDSNYVLGAGNDRRDLWISALAKKRWSELDVLILFDNYINSMEYNPNVPYGMRDAWRRMRAEIGVRINELRG